MNCFRCDDSGWVCENHPDRPWEGQHACCCGGAGAPCHDCNAPSEGKEPRLPTSYKMLLDKDG